MTRRSSTMEDVGRRHNKRRCKDLEILNFNSYCVDRVNHFHADLLIELESSIKDKIVELNKQGNVRFVFLNGYKDYKRNFQAFHELRSSNKSNLHYLFNSDLERHMELSSFLNHQRNVLSFYITHLKDYCENCIISQNAKPFIEFESQLIKCLKVFKLIPPASEINSCDEELEQYQNIASILRCCHQKNLTNSHIVAEFIQIILNMHLVNSDDAGRIRHESYDNGFLQYAIHHTENEGMDLKVLLSKYSNTEWGFYNQFSILDAMVNGDRDRMLFLLRSGVEIFPPYEQKKSGHNFPGIAQTLTRPQLMILEIMERIFRKNLFHLGALETVTEEHRNCFEIIWQKVPGTLFPTDHFMQALKEEYEHLISCGIEKKKCDKRKNVATRLVKMYVNNFYDIPEADYAKISVSISYLCNMSL